MKPTPLDRILGSLYRGGMAAFGLTVIGLILYIVGGSILLQLDLLQLSYPYLVISRDPILLLLLSAGGLFMTVAMFGLIFYVRLNPGPETDILIVVLLGLIAIGFGASVCYYSFRLLIQIVEWPIHELPLS